MEFLVPLPPHTGGAEINAFLEALGGEVEIKPVLGSPTTPKAHHALRHLIEAALKQFFVQHTTLQDCAFLATEAADKAIDAVKPLMTDLHERYYAAGK